MIEIRTISMPAMNSGAHFQYVSDILKRAEADAKVSEKAASQLAAFKAAIAAEDKVLKVPRKSVLTVQIECWDGVRDGLFTAGRQVASAYSKHPDTEMSDAADEVLRIYSEYGIDSNMQLNRETGMLTNFITDIEEKAASAAATLSLTKLFADLKEANEKVADLMYERLEKDTNSEKALLEKARKVTDAAYAELVRYVNALAVIEGEDEYADFIDNVNKQVMYYKQHVLNTGKGNKGDGGESDRPVIPDEDDDEDDRPVIPDEGDGDGTDEPQEPGEGDDEEKPDGGDGTEPGKDENGDDLPPIE